MDSNHIKAVANVTKGKSSIIGTPTTKTETHKKGENLVVEVTTTFEVENPEDVFSLDGSGITMSLEASN